MANINDPQAVAAERVRLNAFLVSESSAIANWTGDFAGAQDLRIKNSEANFRLNPTSTSTGVLVNMAGTSYAGFGIEKIST